MSNNKGFKLLEINMLRFLALDGRSAAVAKFTKFSAAAVLIAAAMPAFAQAPEMQVSQPQASEQQVSEKPQVIKKAVWSRAKMDSTYDAPQGKGAKSAASSAARRYNAAAVIEGHRPTSPSLLKPVGKCEVDLKGEKLYGFVLDQMMDYATSRLTMSAKSARAKKAAEAAKAARAAEAAGTTGAVKAAGATGAADDLLVKADLAIVCLRSPQACIPAGDVTPADIIDLLPLDNQTVVLHLKGKCVRELLRHTAQLGGVSSLDAGSGAAAAGATAAGAAAAGATAAGADSFEDDRVYRVVTIDHLLKGEFGAQVIKQAQKLDNYNMPLGNTLIQNIKKLTQRGETIK